MPNKNKKYTNQSNKYAIWKNTPTKIPSTPSQSKEYAKQNTKYAILVKRIRQPKHQVRHFNQKNTPTKTPNTPSQSKEYANVNFIYNIDLRALSWGNYWREFTHFLAYNLKFWKLRWRIENDKSQVWPSSYKLILMQNAGPPDSAASWNGTCSHWKENWVLSLLCRGDQHPRKLWLSCNKANPSNPSLMSHYYKVADMIISVVHEMNKLLREV